MRVPEKCGAKSYPSPLDCDSLNGGVLFIRRERP